MARSAGMGAGRLGGSRGLRRVAIVAAFLMAVAAMASLLTATPTGRAADGVQFEKYWDDAGYEDRRPGSVAFHLFREDAPDAEVASVTLTAADAVSGEPDHWHGTFSGVPITDGDGEEIPYIVREDVPDGYIASYDYGYDGYEVEFTDDSRLYSTSLLHMGYEDENGDWHGGQIDNWSAGRLPSSSDLVSIGDITYLVSPASSGSSIYLNPPTITGDDLIWQRYDMKYIEHVTGTDYGEMRSMTEWPVGYSLVWEYRANLGRHTPRMRINVQSVSWGHGNERDDPGGVRFQVAGIRPTRGSRPLEVTDTINLRDYPVRKVWDDAGAEAHRPSSVTVDIYQDGSSEPYATRTVTASSSTDAHTWEFAFEDLPRFFDDGSYREHEYTIVERPVDGYRAEYNSDYYDGLEFEFDDDTMIGFSEVWGSLPGDQGWVQAYRSGSGWYMQQCPKEDGSYRVCSAATGLRHTTYGDGVLFYRLEAGDPSWTSDYSPGLGLKAIRRVHLDISPRSMDMASDSRSQELREAVAGKKLCVMLEEGQHYAVPKDEGWYQRRCYYYKWDYSRPFAGADTITNRTSWQELTFTKAWDDAGVTNRRPSECTFDLLSADGTVERTVTLTADDADPSDSRLWRGSFGLRRAYDDEGRRIPYVIRERPVLGYRTLYGSDDPAGMGLDITFAGNRPFGEEKYRYALSDVYADGLGNAYAYEQPPAGNGFIHANSDGTVTLHITGSRVLVYCGDNESVEVAGISHTAMSEDAQALLLKQGSQNMPLSRYYDSSGYVGSFESPYGLVTLTPESSLGTIGRPAGKDNWYLAYEQTQPFAYDNVIRNKAIPELQILKYGNSSAVRLAGAKFSLLRDGEGGPVEVGRCETDQNGSGRLLVPSGEYVIRESSPPKGFLAAEDIRVKVLPSGAAATFRGGRWVALGRQGPVLEPVTVVDVPSLVAFRKLGDDGAPLAGAKLQVMDDGGQVVLEFVSGADPAYAYGMLTGGCEYALHEVSAPEGYALAEDVRFVVSGDATAAKPQVVTMRDSLIRATISKQSVTGGKEVPGATLTLSVKGGREIETWVSGDEPHLINKGILRRGETYVLHEEAAPDGYAYAEDIEFQVGDDGPDARITMRDKPTRVLISKVAISGGEELPGARLRVTDGDGAVIDEWVSGDAPHAIEGRLVAGETYVLHEEAAPDGHAYAADIEFRVSEDGSVDRVEMVDEPLPSEGGDGDRGETGGESPVDAPHATADGDAGMASGRVAAGGQGAQDGGRGGAAARSAMALVQTGDAIVPVAVSAAAAAIAAAVAIRRRRL